MRILREFVAIMILMAAAASAAYSFTFEPISQTFASSGRGATKSFVCTNTENHDIAVQITMVTRHMNLDGKESYTSAASQFVVFPSQVVLKPDSSQVIRVRWTGPSNVSSELSYRIIAAQLPVNFGEEKEKGGRIRILFRYLGTVYITPTGASADVVLEKAAPGKGPDGKAGLYLTFKNKGTKHALLDDLSLTVTGQTADGAQVDRKLGPDMLDGIVGDNVLAESTRRFFVPVPGTLPERNLHVDFSFQSSQ